MEELITMGNIRRKKNEPIKEFNERASKYYYSNGCHIKEISDKLGIDEIVVYNYVVTSGLRITTSEERDEMISLHNQGYSYTAIGKIFNKSRTCVRERINTPARARKYMTNEINGKKIDRMVEMSREGAYIKTIAEEIGISTASVKYRLKHTGRVQKYKFVSKDDLNEFIRLFNEGKTYADIARICNRGRNTVMKHLKRAGYYRY